MVIYFLKVKALRCLEIVSQGLEFVSQGLELVSQGLELVSQGLELVSQGLELKKILPCPFPATVRTPS
jgi:hypothetical protein